MRTMLGFEREGVLLLWGAGESRKHDWGGGISVWGGFTQVGREGGHLERTLLR